MMKFALIAALIFVVALTFFSLTKDKEISTVKIGNTTVKVELADVEEERMQGLSGRESLAEGNGLLFVFEKEGDYGFWMKDMKFAIDIAWIDKNQKIVHEELGVSPETYPQIFQPFTQNLYVLEVPAGFLTKNNIKIGDFVDF